MCLLLRSVSDVCAVNVYPLLQFVMCNDQIKLLYIAIKRKLTCLGLRFEQWGALIYYLISQKCYLQLQKQFHSLGSGVV